MVAYNFQHSQIKQAQRRLRSLCFAYKRSVDEQDNRLSVHQKFVPHIKKLLKFLRARMARLTFRKMCGTLLLVLPGVLLSGQIFKSPESIYPNALDGRCVPELVDYDLDGDLDICGLVLFDGTFYLENEGNSAFFEFDNFQSNILPITDDVPYGIYLNSTDMDGDGDKDFISMNLAIEYIYSKLVYFENLGDNNFAPPEIESIPFVSSSYAPLRDLALVDFDEDGDIDLFAIRTNAHFSVDSAFIIDNDLIYFENTGSPTEPNWIEPVINPMDFQSVSFSNNSNYNVQLEMADYDGDGDIDLIISPLFLNISFNSIIMYVENKSGTWGLPTQIAGISNLQGKTFLSTGDLDADGDLDLLVSNQRYSVEQGDALTELFWLENDTQESTSIKNTSPLNIKLVSNLVVDKLQIEIGSEHLGEKIKFEILDHQGKSFMNGVLDASIGQSISTIELGPIPKSMYYISLSGLNAKPKTWKFVVF